MKQFCVILTRESRLRFKHLGLEHGLLHDKAERKSYAVVADALPTNWAGRWSRAYLIHETSAQTVHLENGGAREVHGGTVRVFDPLNMLAKIKMPGPRTEDGQVREVHLTAESIYDRTLAHQVRRLGNRRYNLGMGLLLVGFGVALGLILVAVTMLLGGGGDAPDPAPAANIVVPNGPPAAPQSGPVEGIAIEVARGPRSAEPDRP